MAVPCPVGDVKIVFPISTFVLNTLILKKVPCKKNDEGLKTK